MKANLTNSRSSDNIHKARKESHFYREIAAIDPKSGRAVVIARFYWPSGVCYSCLWVNGVTHARGAGKAGGDTLQASALRHINSNPLRRVCSDLTLTFTEIEKGFEQ